MRFILIIMLVMLSNYLVSSNVWLTLSFAVDMMAVLPLAISAVGNPYLEQAMVGLMLGDGTLVKKYTGGGTYFKFAQGTIHYGYLLHVFNLFQEAGLVLMTAPSMGTSVINGVTYTWAQFTTVSLAAWNTLHSMWYVNGVKVIPMNIDLLLTPIAMAYWFMDDGGWTGPGIHINTNSFTQEDVLRLLNVLKNKYGLKCSIHSRNRIYIWAGSTAQFIDIVRPYIHEDMAYKLSAK